MQAVILAAGVGSRLGKPFPKCLCALPGGETILGRQIRLLRQAGVEAVIVAVGFKMALIMEAFPDVSYRYNPLYYVTNTSKSLAWALRYVDDDVLWMNGDVIFDEAVLPRLLAASGDNLVCVDQKRCGEEEVKYACGPDGAIRHISKLVSEAEGEALGINLLRRKSLPAFKEALDRCDDLDYFERGLEFMIRDGTTILPLDISDCRCLEVDVKDDWEAALRLFADC